jgi:hypothetical protein
MYGKMKKVVKLVEFLEMDAPNFELAVRKEGDYGTIYERERKISGKCSGNR